MPAHPSIGNAIPGCEQMYFDTVTGTYKPVPVNAMGSSDSVIADTAGNEVGPLVPTNADGAAAVATLSMLPVVSYQAVFNGTTWDRMRGTVNDGIFSTLKIGGSVVSTTNALPMQGTVGAGNAVNGNPVRMGASDGTNVQNVRAVPDNAVLPTAGNLTGITGFYNASLRTLTSGNVGFVSLDRNGRKLMSIGATLDPVLLGYSSVTVQAAASTNAANLKATAGMVYEVSAANQAAYDVFIRLYNKATAPTVGTDVAVRTIRVPAGQTVTVPFPSGAYFSAGVGYATTKLIAYNDATALVANDCVFTIQYA
jgi:hypothetical protein